MAEEVCNDEDHNFDYVSTVYLSKSGDSIILEVEGRPGEIEHIYLSPENCQKLINRLTVYLRD